MDIIPVAFIVMNLAAWLGLMAVSVFHIREKIPPNKIVGLRTRRTLSDKNLWYIANKYMGRQLVMAGFVICAGFAGLLLLRNQIPADAFLLLGTMITGAGVMFVALRSFFYINKL